MSVNVDVFWSFRSPYSYLVTPDLIRLREDFDVDVHLRPVLPIAVRAKETLFTGDRRRVQYIINDAARRAEFLGMKYGFPSPDPIVQDMKTFEVAENQPYIFRLTGLGIEAARRGKGFAAIPLWQRKVVRCCLSWVSWPWSRQWIDSPTVPSLDRLGLWLCTPHPRNWCLQLPPVGQ